MIGYTEEPFNVLKKISHQVEGECHTYELRQLKEFNLENSRFAFYFTEMKKNKPEKYKKHEEEHESNMRPYISIQITNSQNSDIDLLLFYSEELNNDCVNNDWKLLEGKTFIKLEELSHDSRIEDHVTGYCNNGSITMY